MLRNSTQYGEQQLFAAARNMMNYGGGFASCIGDAFFLADSGNRAKLVAAFADLFDKYAKWPG